MPRFKVDVTRTIGFTATVEANDAEDAWELVASLDESDFDTTSFTPTEEEVEHEHRGCTTVTISKAEEVDFEIHYPALEVEE